MSTWAWDAVQGWVISADTGSEVRVDLGARGRGVSFLFASLSFCMTC